MADVAHIAINEIVFIPATAPATHFSQAKFAITNGPLNNISFYRDTFWIKKKIKLIFYSPNDAYEPLDLWFLQTAGNTDLDGKKTFNDIKPAKNEVGGKMYNTVEVTDNFATFGASWKVMIPIMKTPIGPVGLIDPEISNTSEFPPLDV